MALHRSLLALATLATLVACGGDKTPIALDESAGFSGDFLFGAAIAGFQVDMGCPTLPADKCEDPNSDWYQFASSPETIADDATHLSGQPLSVSPGHWELYEHDYDLVKNELHGNAMRLSIEWSRIFPTATDDANDLAALAKLANPEAVAHYHAELSALKSRGLKPVVTLNHYTLPTWIHDAVGCHEDLDGCSPRGWLDADRTVREIAKYAGFVAAEFGAQVDLWVTENEPFAVVLPGYVLPSADRSNPPAVRLKFDEAKTVIKALVYAHAKMYDAIRWNDAVDADMDGKTAEVGLVYSMAPVAPRDAGNPIDVEAAKNVFYLYNMVFMNAVAKGELDEELDGHPVVKPELQDRLDFVGINYYTRATVDGTVEPFIPALSPLTTFNPLTMTMWEDYPKGIYEMAMLVKSEFNLPVIITENGTPDPDDDGTAPSYLVRHLQWLSRAMDDGVDVRGYFYWSLMDNYEWNHGMDMRFGMYAVDEHDPMKTRKPRRTVSTFAAITKAGAIPDDLIKEYGQALDGR